jgi:predicted CXXCH cytochrome family protein
VASVAQVCRRCHAQNGILFDSSRHKQVFEEHKWPECGQCHGHHDIQKPTVALIGDTDDTLCGKCHNVYSRKDPKCNETAVHFRKALDAMIAGRAQVSGEEEHLAEAGLDVEPLARSLSDLDEALVQSKSKVHSFDIGTFDQAAQPGDEALQKSRQQIVEAKSEYGFRRRGLLAAIGFMVLMVAGIGLKLRQLERTRTGAGKV